MTKNVQFSDLIGKTLTKIDKSDDELIFHCDDGAVYRMYHFQDCCERVTIEDICGDLDDLIGVPIAKAEESSGRATEEDSFGECGTWTFYKIATVKGYVDIRWYGTSKGCYSEDVEFELIRNGDENGK